jgi:hypothetical protein
MGVGVAAASAMWTSLVVEGRIGWDCRGAGALPALMSLDHVSMAERAAKVVALVTLVIRGAGFP